MKKGWNIIIPFSKKESAEHALEDIKAKTRWIGTVEPEK